MTPHTAHSRQTRTQEEPMEPVESSPEREGGEGGLAEDTVTIPRKQYEALMRFDEGRAADYARRICEQDVSR